MKTFLTILTVMMGLVGLHFVCGLLPAKKIDSKEVLKKPFFRIAHRCGAGEYPEDTLYACKKIKETAIADVLEMDVHLTKDKKLVVIHDETIDRTTNGKGKVADMNFEEINALDAAYHFSTDGGKTFPLRGKGVKIEQLSKFFEEIPDYKYYIEVKPASREVAGILAETVKQFKMENKVVVGSFDDGAKDELTKQLPTTAIFGSKGDITTFTLSQKLNANGFFAPKAHTLAVPSKRSLLEVKPGYVYSAHRQNIHIHVWTINEEEEMKKLIYFGVDGIMTDKPTLLDTVIKSRLTNQK